MCAQPANGYFDVGKKWFFECPGGTNSVFAVLLTVALTALVFIIWFKIMSLAEGSIYDSFDVGVKFLHLIGFIAQFRLRWHPNLDPVVLILLVANLEVDFISPHCVWATFNGFTEFFFQLLVPFVIVAFALLNWQVKMHYRPGKYPLELAMNEPLLNKNKLRDGTVSITDWKIYAVQKSIQVFGFMYQILAYTAFSSFACTARPDESFLTSAPDVTCGSNEHKIMMAFSAVYISVFLIALPVFVLSNLIRGRKNNILLEGYFVQTYGCIYEQFKIEFVWWEGVIVVRKLLISIILALVPLPMIQGALTVILIYVSILIHLMNFPYFSSVQNILEVICLFCALGFVVSGMIFYPTIVSSFDCAGTNVDPAYQSTCLQSIEIKQSLSVGLICLVSLTFLLSIMATCLEIYERHLSAQTSREIESRRKWFGMKLREKRKRRASSIITKITKYVPRVSSNEHFTLPFQTQIPRSESDQSKADDLISGRKDSMVGLLLRSATDSGFSSDAVADLDSTDDALVMRTDVTSRRDSSVDDTKNPLKMHLCHMLDGFYLSSWRSKLKELERWDQNFRIRYKKENPSSILLMQELAYVEMDYILPRCSCLLFSNLAPLSNSAVSALSRQLLSVFPALIDYMSTADSQAREGIFAFVQDYINFEELSPMFWNENRRDKIISDEYIGNVAQFLLESVENESTQSERIILQQLLDEIRSNVGIQKKTKKCVDLEKRRSSVFEGLNKVARLSVCVDYEIPVFASGNPGTGADPTPATPAVSASLVHTPRNDDFENTGYLTDSDRMKVSSTLSAEEANSGVADKIISNKILQQIGVERSVRRVPELNLHRQTQLSTLNEGENVDWNREPNKTCFDDGLPLLTGRSAYSYQSEDFGSDYWFNEQEMGTTFYTQPYSSNFA